MLYSTQNVDPCRFSSKKFKNILYFDKYERGMLFMPIGVGTIMFYSVVGILQVLIHRKKIVPPSNVGLLLAFFITTATFIWIQLAHPGWLVINASYAAVYVWYDATAEDMRRQELYNQIHKSNEALKAALDRAEAATQAKSDFLSNMSHDIRTPMNAVMGFAALLAKEPDNGVKVREYTRKISAASNHLLGLINDILDIPVIAMTANAFVKDVHDALDAGMNAHIAKPLNLETLKSTLGSCLKKAE